MRTTIKLKRPITDLELDIDENSIIPHWIPVTERLPERDFVNVLVCLRDVRIGCEHSYYFAEAHVSRGQWNMTLESDISDLEILAWMPLPEPWRK